MLDSVPSFTLFRLFCRSFCPVGVSARQPDPATDPVPPNWLRTTEFCGICIVVSPGAALPKDEIAAAAALDPV